MASILGILVRELGLWSTIKTIIGVASAQRRGEPFSELAPPDSENEILSRKQIGPAILLYRAIRELLPEQAMHITEKVVTADGVKFMQQSLGKLKLKELPHMPQQERQRYVSELGDRFFNAQIRWDHIGEERVQFTVTHCRFPSLCREAGVPELAILFCKVDEAYFGHVEEQLKLTRPHSIASGADECPFTLTRHDS